MVPLSVQRQIPCLERLRSLCLGSSCARAHATWLHPRAWDGMFHAYSCHSVVSSLTPLILVMLDAHSSDTIINFSTACSTQLVLPTSGSVSGPTDCVQAEALACPTDVPSCGAGNKPSLVALTCEFPTLTAPAAGGQTCTRTPTVTTLPFYQEAQCKCANFKTSQTNIVSGTPTVTLIGDQLCTSTRNQAAPTGSAWYVVMLL